MAYRKDANGDAGHVLIPQVPENPAATV